jgi:hypothetical protein
MAKEVPLSERETMEVVYNVMTRDDAAPPKVTPKPAAKAELRRETAQPRVSRETIKDDESKQTRRSVERDDYKPYREFEKEWKPYLDSLKIKPLDAAKHLLAVEHTLRFGSNDAKLEALRVILKDYNIDPKTLVSGKQERVPYVPPHIKAANERLDRLESDNQARDKAEQQRVYQGALSMVDKFKKQKNQNGELMFPHIDTVADEMAFLIKSKKAKSFSHAYQMAVFMNDETRPLVTKNSASPPARVQTPQRIVPRGRSQIGQRMKPQSERETMEAVYTRLNGQ